MSAPPDFDDFRALSAALGEDPLRTQGAGGNTSIKSAGTMWVKASGAWLKHAVSKNIFVEVDRAMLKPIVAEAARPSIETSLHAVLPHRIVVHLHDVSVMALAVRHDAAERCADRLAGLRFAFIPYAKPGDALADALRKTLRPTAPDIFILGNHGLIVGGETVDDVKARLAEVGACMPSDVRSASPADRNFLEQARLKGWRLPVNAAVYSLATDADNLAFATGGTLYPDHVVFLGRGCQSVSADKIATIDPVKQPMMLVEGKGVLLSPMLSPAGEAMAECLAAVLSRIPVGAELNYLSSRDEDELLNWDAEKYRQAAK